MFELENVTKTYGDLLALDRVSFTLEEGEALGLIGASGSGKSTLARLLMGLDRMEKGEIRYQGRAIAGFSKSEWKKTRLDVQMVFQDPTSSLSPRMSIEEILCEPLIIQNKKADLQAALNAVGLPSFFLKRRASDLSGGQKQRIAIARALILRPKCLVLDEPISALDVSVGAQIINLLIDLKKELGLTLLFITHDLALLRYLCDRAVVLEKGRLIEMGPVERLFQAPQRSHTKALLSASVL